MNDLTSSLETFVPGINLIPSSTETLEQATTLSLDLGTKATQYGIALVIALCIVAVGWTLAGWIAARVRMALKRAKVDETPANFLASTVRFVILTAAVIIAIIQLGVPASSLVTVVGALMVALGLGLKDTLTNVAAGIMLLVNQPFKVGDYIEIDGQAGTVRSINLFQTELNTYQNVHIFIPNQKVWDNTVLNYTHNRQRMVEVFVGLDYSHNVAECKKAIEKALKKDKRILDNPEYFIGVDELADSSVNFRVRCWVKTTDWVAVRYSLLDLIKAECEGSGLSIPFPQRVVHMAPSEDPKPAKKKPATQRKKG